MRFQDEMQQKRKSPLKRGTLSAPSNALDFLDFRGLALPITQIVELRAANLAVPDHFHAVNAGGVDRERTLHADTIGNPTDRKGLTDAAVALGNHSAFESLKPLTGTFYNLHPDANGVANVDLRKIGPQLLGLDGTNDLIQVDVPPSLSDVHSPVHLPERTGYESRPEDRPHSL